MKPITITPDVIEKACEQLRERLTNTRILSDTFNISVPTKLTLTDEDKPTIFVTLNAHRKMRALVGLCTQEIGWHGTVHYEGDTNTYIIEDIVVFPQKVNGSTVDAIIEQYGPWLMELDDDTFNKLRFHGHSHVNMATNPSGVDVNYQQQLLNNVQDFYIFMITNKKEDYYLCLFDVANNRLYEKDDIFFDIEIEENYGWAQDTITKHVKQQQHVNPIVKQQWETGYKWDVDAKGYIPTNTTYIKEPAALVEASKLPSRAGRKKKDKKPDAYTEYQRDKVKQITAKKRNASDPDFVCLGYCDDCEKPCNLASFYR